APPAFGRPPQGGHKIPQSPVLRPPKPRAAGGAGCRSPPAAGPLPPFLLSSLPAARRAARRPAGPGRAIRSRRGRRRAERPAATGRTRPGRAAAAHAACGPRPAVSAGGGGGRAYCKPRRVADGAGPCRLAAALAAALGEGAERRRELEGRVARSRDLLRHWGSEEEEGSQPGTGSSGGHENRPSPKELEELELLNKALEKALKVRKSILKTPLEVQGATGEKSVGKKSCGFLQEPSKKEDPTAESALGRSTSPRTVTLQEKGCQLKLPLPYRKAYSRNSRAWKRCHLCQTSVEAAAARNRFIEGIQTTFCSPMPAFSPAEIEEELKVLQDIPALLSQHVEAESADHPTLQREYESLLTLESLQTTVSQCLHKLQLLRTAVESQMSLCPDCTGDAGSCSPACIPPRGQMCDSAGMLAVPLLCYSSFQELRDLFALKLKVSMLHQEIALQKENQLKNPKQPAREKRVEMGTVCVSSGLPVCLIRSWEREGSPGCRWPRPPTPPPRSTSWPWPRAGPRSPGTAASSPSASSPWSSA
uniref:TEDC2 protein n=1 Tax=Falco tinnunculus TaxID=100819 RepID=A0A8C4XUA6_FALTI